jgi:hypothetical protein
MERHGPLAAGLKLFASHTLKYVQNYALPPETPIPNHAANIDGVSELWFDDVAALNAAYADPLYMSLIRPDELSFCDLNSITGRVGREIRITVEPDDESDQKWIRKSRSRLLVYRKAGAGISDAAFQQDWLHAAEAITQEPHFQRLVRAYVQTHIQNNESPLPSTCPFAVIDEFWFRSDADAITYWTKRQDSQVAQTHTAPDDALAFFARSHIVFENTRAA